MQRRLPVLAFCLVAGMLAAQPIERKIKISKGQTYLNLPVDNSARLVRARIKEGDKVLDQFTIKLAEGNPAFWTFFDVTELQGKTITIEIENYISPFAQEAPGTESNLRLAASGLDKIYADARLAGADSLYRETLRPQVHFSAQRGWINDPNGLVFYDGEYHLYFQHNPYGWEWGNMHWGHAVSEDLIHWHQLKEAIYPMPGAKGARPDAAFSGSAVYDPTNTSGFRKDGIDPLIAVYTSTGRGECLKLSYDNGRTFADYDGNPILAHNGRDPKVFWYEPGKHWVMVVWDNGQKRTMSMGMETAINQNLIYTSPDLKQWTYRSGVPGFFECPELFELPVEGHPGISKWVMYDAKGRYIVGDFDGKVFTKEQSLTTYAYGGGYFYASQTYNNDPEKRRIQIGWGRNITHAGMPFNQPLLFPTTLSLKQTIEGYRLCPVPIGEISLLHKDGQTVENRVIKPSDGISLAARSDALHIIAEFEKGDAAFSLNILGRDFSYNDLLGEFVVTSANDAGRPSNAAGPFPTPDCDLRISYARPAEVTFKIEAIVDKNIIEVFVNDGELYYVAPFDDVKTGTIEASVRGRGGDRKAIVKKMDVYALNSIWNESQ